MILGMGLVSAYFFSLIGRVCGLTGAKSYRHAWELTLGNTGSQIVTIVCTFKPAIANLAYSMILADSFRSLLQTIGIRWSRGKVLIVITVVLLWPLCLLKNLKVLAPFSVLGIAAMVATIIAMAVRFFDGTYSLEQEGTNRSFLPDLPEKVRPSFGTVGMSGTFRPEVFNLLCMLATAYVAHYNSPRFYIELENNTIPRFNIVVVISYIASAMIYVVIAAVGFLTFGENSSGYILNNYSTNDMLATFSRISVAVSISLTYPIVFVGVRDGILDMMKVPVDQRTPPFLNLLSAVILCVLTIMAATFTDLGVILSLGGATFGTAVIYVFPSLMFCTAVRDLGDGATDSLRQEVKLATFFMWFGIVVGAIGTYMSIFGGFSE
jgi:amino acid permease